MAKTKLGEQWRPKRSVEVWAIDEMTSTQVRLRNVRTRKTRRVSTSLLLRSWVQVERKATPPAQPSVLDAHKRALADAYGAHDFGAAERALASLVSEVRAECAREANDEAKGWRSLQAEHHLKGRSVAAGQCGAAATAASVVAARIRARDQQ